MREYCYLKGAEAMSLSAWVSAMVPKEPGPAPVVSENDVVEETNLSQLASDHLRFLKDLSAKTDYSLPEALESVVGEKLISCSGNDLYRALVYAKITKDRPTVPKKNQPWPSAALEKMRTLFSEWLQKKISSLNIHLHDRMLARFHKSFKGTKHTRAGQLAEERVALILHTLLEKVEFEERDGTKLRLFGLVSPVAGTGCISPSVGSFCVASNDGCFASKQSYESPMLAWNLEVKLKATEATASIARQLTANKIFRIHADYTPEEFALFRDYVLEDAYALQLIHHCAATRIPRVLLVIVDGPTGEIMRYVAVFFDEGVLQNHRNFIDYFSSRFTPFLHHQTKLTWGGVPPERLNFHRVLRELCTAIENKVDDKAVLPVMVYLYNQSKSGVDVLHREMAKFNTSHMGQIRKIMASIFDILFLSIRRAHRACEVVGKLDSVICRDQLVRLINDVGSDDELVNKIATSFKREDFGLLLPLEAEAVRTVIPVTTNPHWRPEDPEFCSKLIDKRNHAAGNDFSRLTEDDRDCGHSDTVLWFFSDPLLNALRTNVGDSFQHSMVRVEAKARKHCVLCCMGCEKAVKKGVLCTGARHGHPTQNKCRLCQAFLCDKPRAIWGGEACVNVFHSCIERPMAHPFKVPASTEEGSSSLSVASPVVRRAAVNDTPAKVKAGQARKNKRSRSTTSGAEEQASFEISADAKTAPSDDAAANGSRKRTSKDSKVKDPIIKKLKFDKSAKKMITD